jgi:hypothetical protein
VRHHRCNIIILRIGLLFSMSNIEKLNSAIPSKKDRQLLMQRNKKSNEENMKNVSQKNSNKVHPISSYINESAECIGPVSIHNVYKYLIITNTQDKRTTHDVNVSKERAKSILTETQQASSKRTRFDVSIYLICNH